ncbi:MAG: hypothetical protein AAGA46_09465 [Cyanobacteria bacterium P01_F01_bin.13]
MKQNRAQFAAKRQVLPRHSSHWLQTVSGMAVLTVGLQGAAANADRPVPLADGPAGVPTGDFTIPDAVADTVNSETDVIAPVAPAPARPKFSPFRLSIQNLIRSDTQLSDTSLPVNRLDDHRRGLHRRSNEVESKLLGLQQLLSIQSYGTSFADRLLDEDDTYQTKLQQLQGLEADIHTALEQADDVALNRLQNRLQQVDRELQQMAQAQLRQYVERVQGESTLGLWQEPMYRQSLRWLMEYTHERHLLQARQQTLARTLVAIAPD